MSMLTRKGKETLLLVGCLAVGTAVVIALWGLLAPVARGEEREGVKLEAPKPKEPVKERVADRRYWLVMSALGASKAADMVTTRRWLDGGGDHYETNWIYGKHPSSLRLAGTAGGYYAAEAVLAYQLKKWGKRRWWARAWIIEPAFQTQEHCRFAWGNERRKR